MFMSLIGLELPEVPNSWCQAIYHQLQMPFFKLTKHQKHINKNTLDKSIFNHSSVRRVNAQMEII